MTRTIQIEKCLQTLDSKIGDHAQLGPIHIRVATETDISLATKIIRNSFEVWKQRGLNLSPMRTTDEQTRANFQRGGFMIEVNNQTVGTFCIDNGQVERDGESISYLEGLDRIPFNPIGDPSDLLSTNLMVFKRFAIDGVANSGVGTQVMTEVENMAKQSGFEGLVIETTRETDWLHEWYLKLGFKEVGYYRYPGSPLDTILMVKIFDDAI